MEARAGLPDLVVAFQTHSSGDRMPTVPEGDRSPDPEPPLKRKWRQFGLSTMFVGMVIMSIVLAVTRPKHQQPKRARISTHRNRVTSERKQEYEQSVREIQGLIKQQRMVGRPANQVPQLCDAEQVEVLTDQISYLFVCDPSAGEGNAVLVVVDARTGLIINAGMVVVPD